jgi:hypothetical protein
MTSRRSALGSDPFEAVLPLSPPENTRAQARPAAPPRRLSAVRGRADQLATRRREPPAEPVGERPKQRITSYLRPAIAEELRDAVRALSGPPEYLTVAAFLERAVVAELARLRRRYNHGEPFPKAAGPLRVGRPIRR